MAVTILNDMPNEQEDSLACGCGCVILGFIACAVLFALTMAIVLIILTVKYA